MGYSYGSKNGRVISLLVFCLFSLFFLHMFCFVLFIILVVVDCTLGTLNLNGLLVGGVAVDIRPQLLELGIDVLLGPNQLLINNLLRLALNRLQLLLRNKVALENVVLHLSDAVTLLANMLHVVTAAVRRARVGHRVTHVAVAIHLDDNGAVLQRVFLRPLGALLHGERVHAVDLDPGDVVAALEEVVVGRGAILRRAHSELVVLAHKERGDLVQRCHVIDLEDLPLVRGTVAVQGDAHVLGVLLALGVVEVLEAETNAKRDLRADDAVAAVVLCRRLVHVHGAALALAAALPLAEHLRKHLKGVPAARNVPAVAAVRRDDGVVEVE
eukprot:PhM_4_TR2788/c0_g1_i1/m.78384